MCARHRKIRLPFGPTDRELERTFGWRVVSVVGYRLWIPQKQNIFGLGSSKKRRKTATGYMNAPSCALSPLLVFFLLVVGGVPFAVWLIFALMGWSLWRNSGIIWIGFYHINGYVFIRLFVSISINYQNGSIDYENCGLVWCVFGGFVCLVRMGGIQTNDWRSVIWYWDVFAVTFDWNGWWLHGDLSGNWCH